MWVSEDFASESPTRTPYLDNSSWIPGVCYHLANRTLGSGGEFRALSQPLRNCMELSPTVTGMLIGTFVLSIFRILLQVVWYNRCDATRDQGIRSNRKSNCKAFIPVTLMLCACATRADREERAKHVVARYPFDHLADYLVSL